MVPLRVAITFISSHRGSVGREVIDSVMIRLHWEPRYKYQRPGGVAVEGEGEGVGGSQLT